jgi:peptide/nickel transport system permease protein
MKQRLSKSYVLSSILRNIAALLGLILLIVFIFIAILAPLLAPYDPLEIDAGITLLPPSREHLFGTDGFGRDIFSRVVFGARLSLLIGGSVSIIAGILGTFFGLVTGYIRYLDEPLMRLMDGLMAFPPILLAVAVMAFLGQGVSNVIMVLALIYLPFYARVIRSRVLVIREQAYIEAAESYGCPTLRIILRHVLPNCMAQLIVLVMNYFAVAVLSEAALNFLGLGGPPEVPSWGNILNEGQRFLRTAWWISFFPGAAIMLMVLSLNLVGDTLRDALDPTMRHAERIG